MAVVGASADIWFPEPLGRSGVKEKYEHYRACLLSEAFQVGLK